MPRSCPKGLTQTGTGYCRTIGFYGNPKGRRVPRKFWGGHDPGERAEASPGVKQSMGRPARRAWGKAVELIGQAICVCPDYAGAH